MTLRGFYHPFRITAVRPAGSCMTHHNKISINRTAVEWTAFDDVDKFTLRSMSDLLGV